MCTKVTYIFVCSLLGALGSPLTDVDQSQSGELNVQVSLKNVEIVALLNGGREQYTDYDYNYDYAEMTIKPPNSTSTLAPSNDTEASNSSQTPLQETTTLAIVEITPPKKDPLFTSEDGISSSTASSLVVLEDTVVGLSSEVMSGANEVSSSTPVSSEPANATTLGMKDVASTQEPSPVVVAVAPLPTDECRKGFRRNKKGECELKIKPNSTNALLRLVELSQKLKLRRAN